MRWIERISISLMHGIFIVLMGMSIYLFKERMFADAAYYLFHAINSEWFHIEHGRTVLGISQLLPVLATWLHLPLKIVVVLGSLGHELFYYSIFLSCLYLLKDKYGAMAVLGIHVIGQLWLYYSPMLEICYGAAIAVAFYSVLRSGKYIDDKWLILLLIFQWFAMMSHPENFLLIGVAIAYDFLNRGYQKSIHLKVIGFAILGFLIEIFTFSEYERGHVTTGDKVSSSSALNLFDGEYLQQVLSVFTEYYLDLILLFILVAIFLLIKKRIKPLLLLLGSVLLLIGIVNHAAEANEFIRYYESMYNPLVFIVVLFFCYELANVRNKWLAQVSSLLLLGIIAIRVCWIYDFGKPLRDRSSQLERIVDYTQNLGDTKYIVNTRNVDLTTWANPIESLLYSAMDGKDKSISLIRDRDFIFNKNNQTVGVTSFIYRMQEIKDHAFLNPQYFQLDAERYQRINNKLTNKPMEWFKGKISISFTGDVEELNDSIYQVSIEIKNTSKVKLPSSIEEQIYLSYHLKDKEGNVLEWDGIRTPLEVDVFDKHRQYIKVKKLDKTPNAIQFIPDLVVEGKFWFDLTQEFKLEL